MPLPAITPSGASTALRYPAQPIMSLGGYTGLISATPPPVNAPIIFEPGADLTGNQLKVVMVVTAVPTLQFGGAQVWASADGTTYGQIGTVYEGGVQGVLTNTFPSGTNPDTVNTLSVDVSMSDNQIVSGSTTDADLGITLAYVGGELVGYSNATLTGVNAYNLDTYLIRGMYGSVIGSHATGSSFGLINGNIFSQIYPSNYVGRTVYFKFLSFNAVGGSVQSLASAVAYPYTLVGNGAANRVKCRTLTSGASTTLALGADYLLNIMKTVGSATTVNGPALPVPDGTRFEIADLGNGGLGDSDSNPITFIPAGGILVAGLSTLVFQSRGGAFAVTYCSSSNQWTVS